MHKHGRVRLQTYDFINKIPIHFNQYGNQIITIVFIINVNYIFFRPNSIFGFTVTKRSNRCNLYLLIEDYVLLTSLVKC